MMPPDQCSNISLQADYAGELKNIVIPFFLILIGICIIVGNSIIVASIALRKKADQHYNTRITFDLVRSLAVADILVGLIAIPSHVCAIWFDNLTISSLKCLIGYSLNMSFCTTSIFHIVMMAADRYLAICKPLYHRSIPRYVTWILVTISWTVPAIFAFPVVMTKSNFRSDLIEECTACDTNLNVTIIFRILSTTVSYILPTLIICVLYIKIYQCIRKRCKENYFGEDIIKPSKVDTAAAKTIGLIVSCYMISWTPFFVIYLFYPLVNSQSRDKIEIFCETWAYFNSIFNPVVYYKCNNCIKRAVKRVFKCGFPANIKLQKNSELYSVPVEKTISS